MNKVDVYYYERRKWAFKRLNKELNRRPRVTLECINGGTYYVITAWRPLYKVVKEEKK